MYFTCFTCCCCFSNKTSDFNVTQEGQIVTKYARKFCGEFNDNEDPMKPVSLRERVPPIGHFLTIQGL